MPGLPLTSSGRSPEPRPRGDARAAPQPLVLVSVAKAKGVWDEFAAATAASAFFGPIRESQRKLVQRWSKKLEIKVQTERDPLTAQAMVGYKKRLDILVLCVNIQFAWTKRASNDKAPPR